MDIDSFEPSDESMEKLREDLQQLREFRATTSKMHFVAKVAAEHASTLKEWLLTVAPQSPELHKRIVGGLHEREAETETAYKRSLRHENLLKELETLGYEQWEKSGKKAQFDDLTEKTIQRGRLAASLESDMHVNHWQDQLRAIRESLKNHEGRFGVDIYNAKNYQGRSALTDWWAKKALAVEHFKPKNFPAGYDVWHKDGDHLRLSDVVEAQGVHAAIAQDEHVISFEPCGKQRRENHG